MIINWFTQPRSVSAKFPYSSYYQYDTVTGKFCRLRLALGRNDSGATKALYEEKRAFGFTNNKSCSAEPITDWSMNNGKLYYKNEPMPSEKPVPGYRVFDVKLPLTPNSEVHKGSAVTNEPRLPGDGAIQPKHLALIANEAMAKGASIRLTAGTASPEELVTGIRNKVCDIVGVDRKDFGTINDDMIHRALVGQARLIGRNTAGKSVSGLDDALTAAKNANDEISRQITDGEFVPTTDSEKVFADLNSALVNAKAASRDVNVRQALTEIGNAQRAVDTLTANNTVIQNEEMSRQLDLATKSLEQARQNATEWRAVETTDYKSLTDTTSVEEYMSAMEDL